MTHARIISRAPCGDASVAARVADLAAGVEGPWARGMCLYAAALHASDGQGMKEAGEYLDHAGVMGFARLALAKSSAMLSGIGLKDQAREARQELRKLSARSGAAVGPAGAGANGALTKHERQIASLALQGLSDREIAADLALSLRTVEGHLYRAYTKLCISAREELAQAL